ncbi:Nuclear GTPase SLIP-GC [Tetrabaena socialis]|uniref:Nuclear GTPase SLIP-GC n=1 Tax=Tetrabaena socialis TaxID=47790 RepID=A0A2J8A2Q7_9CHLO|nr:Nuclear GTPase SLIP-GC [Tetrabaena socialis]|eukprot:PNH06795.1 Nuclear GTPase SLIP-GC [Tetrabaena socialis]
MHPDPARKSSILNVLLGEENILPTNGMRASTGCPIEVSYALSFIYTASVEFVSKDEWHAYVKVLLNDLVGDDGQLRISMGDRPDKRSEAGAAQAALEAVYGKAVVRRPGLSVEVLQDVNNSVTRLLGSTKHIRNHDRKAFRRDVGKYVDSHNRADDLQAWPIVKVAKLQHNWKLLAGGAVLVDLPGVRDANEARGAVAEAYMRRLDSVWVVADITRAVDDKTAKDLLGSDFRRRMVMDGQLDAIAFVCTKTDNIEVGGTMEELGLEEVASRSGVPYEELLALDERITQHKAEEAGALKASGAAGRKAAGMPQRVRTVAREARFIHGCLAEAVNGGLGAALDDAAATQEAMERLERPVAAAEGLAARKTAKQGGGRGPRGGVAAGSEEEEASEDEAEEGSSEEGSDDGEEEEAEAESDDGGDDDEEEDDDSDQGGGKRRRRRGAAKRKRKSAAGRKPSAAVTRKYRSKGAVELLAALEDAVQRLQKAMEEHAQLARARRVADDAAAGATARLQRPQRELKAACARARNHYSRERLQQDFQDGIADMETLSAEKRVERPQLPVFCVSARDAQQLEGRNRRDGGASAFTRLEHTEVPGLRKHVRETADRGRLRAQKELAQSVFAQIESVGTALLSQSVDARRAASAKEMFEGEIRQLNGRLEEHAAAVMRGMVATFLDRGLSPRLAQGWQQAAAAAPGKAHKWGTRLRFTTYKVGEGGGGAFQATVQRNGTYTSSSAGEIDFNGELCGPLLDSISMTWDHLFNRKLGEELTTLRGGAVSLLDSFLAGVREALVEELGLRTELVEGLQAQVLRDQTRQLRSRLEAVAAKVHEASKAMSRDVVEPQVREALRPAYQAATMERGSGSFKRMKAAMEGHVAGVGGTALRQAAGSLEAEVRSQLDAVTASLKEALQAMLQAVAARFTVLWDEPACAYQERYAAAASLQQLAEQAGVACRKAGVEVGKVFSLQPQQQEPQQADTDPGGDVNDGEAEYGEAGYGKEENGGDEKKHEEDTEQQVGTAETADATGAGGQSLAEARLALIRAVKLEPGVDPCDAVAPEYMARRWAIVEDVNRVGQLPVGPAQQEQVLLLQRAFTDLQHRYVQEQQRHGQQEQQRHAQEQQQHGQEQQQHGQEQQQEQQQAAAAADGDPGAGMGAGAAYGGMADAQVVVTVRPAAAGKVKMEAEEGGAGPAASAMAIVAAQQGVA